MFRNFKVVTFEKGDDKNFILPEVHKFIDSLEDEELKEKVKDKIYNAMPCCLYTIEKYHSKLPDGTYHYQEFHGHGWDQDIVTDEKGKESLVTRYWYHIPYRYGQTQMIADVVKEHLEKKLGIGIKVFRLSILDKEYCTDDGKTVTGGFHFN